MFPIFREVLINSILCCLIMLSGCATDKVGPVTGKKYFYLAAVDMWGSGEDETAYDRETRLANYLKKYPETSSSLRQSILNGSLVIGMTQEQVLVALGKPEDINKTVTPYGTTEQWVYTYYLDRRQRVDLDRTKSKYVYFENGVLTSWQE